MSFDHTILKGTSSKIIEVILRDSATGAGKTAVAYTDVTASYVREGSTRTAITLAAGTAGDAYSSGKWCEVDATNCPGLYQLHLPDAALATGVNAVTTTMIASGVIDKVVRISLLDVDLRDATDAGLSNLDAAISTRSTFNSASDQVTVSTNNDKTGYSISGTKTTLDALNDIAASAIVSGGAITTSGGAVSNVTLVATTTTNTDMRGTDGAFLAASAPANFGSLGINASGHLLRTVLNDTTTTNTDMVSVTGLSTFDPATDQVIVGTNTDKTDYALSSAANDAIGAAFLAYTLTKGSPGTIERAFWQSLKATQLADGEVSGTPTASAFDTNLTAVTGAYNHLLLLFTSGSLAGEARPIATYNSTNGRITLQEALTAAPSSSDEFIVVPDHTDPISDIYAYFTDGSNEDAFKADVSALSLQASVDTIDGIVDAIKVKTDELTFTVPGSVDATATVVGGDATAANQTTIISHLTDIKGGTFDDTTDSLEAIRDRGDIAWATAGTGIYSLTVTVKDVSDNLISGARVNIDGTASTLTSNSSGQVVFNLDAGSYTLVTSPPSGYQTPANVNVTVSSDDSSEIILTATSTTSDAGWLG